MAEIETYIAIALGIVAIASVGYNIAHSMAKKDKESDVKLNAILTELNGVKLKVDVLWKIFEEQIPKLLAKPGDLK